MGMLNRRRNPDRSQLLNENLKEVYF